MAAPAPPHRLKTTIAIIGAGDVGSTIAYTLILSSTCSEVIMVDPKKELLEGQVRDLGDATYGGRSGTKVRVGTSKEAGQADVIVVTAGAKQRDGEFLRGFLQYIWGVCGEGERPRDNIHHIAPAPVYPSKENRTQPPETLERERISWANKKFLFL